MAASALMAQGVPPFPKFILASGDIQLRLAKFDSFLTTTQVIFTWIVYGVPTIIELIAPRFYYRLAVLVAYTLSAIFWLTGWTWGASWASYMNSFSGDNDNRDNGGLWNTFGSVMGACAGLGALTWVLTVVELTFFCKACLQNPNSRYAGHMELR
ncbi:hypothetical protein AAE478_000648 [Parahypoxylon ruwenzoriense]